jgi:hypothetical protein
MSGLMFTRTGRWRRAERNKPVIASQGGISEPPNTLLRGKTGGAAAVRRTPRNHYLPGRRSDAGC